MPSFAAGDDPGPSFVDLVRRVYPQPDLGGMTGELDLPHGTTVLAVRYTDGVVIAGDRRATSGNMISHRTIKKVFSSDRHSGVAIAGAAGPAVEMVRLYQLQLEHYEKVEGVELSLEGKANQLSQMLRNNLPMAMQGMVVIPIFAGYDRRRGYGRLFQFDITGGRYEEANYATSGSGSIFAGTVLKLGFAEGLDRDRAIGLALLALFEAADDDSATGAPDLVRGIYPTIATITSGGFEWVDDTELASRFDTMAGQLNPATAAPMITDGDTPASGGATT